MEFKTTFLYNGVHGVLKTVCDVLVGNLRLMLEARSISDPNLSELKASQLRFVPTSFAEIFKILIAFFSKYV